MTEQIQYHVTVDGDQYAHEALRTAVHELSDASIEAELSTNFQPLGPEGDDMRVVCVNCDSSVRCSDATVSVDAIDVTENDVVVRVERQYLCSETCADGFAMTLAAECVDE